MSEKRENTDDPAAVPKRQKLAEHATVTEGKEEEEEEHCIVCMRTEAELTTADCPMREEHGCPRCTKTSWYDDYTLHTTLSTVHNTVDEYLHLTSCHVFGSQEHLRGV
jgi:hypothetical protein